MSKRSTMKKVLIIQGNPTQGSYGEALGKSYAAGASSAGAEVRMLPLGELEFNLNLAGGYRDMPPLEPDLVKAQEWIIWADHLVFVFPIWWGGVPALLKGFLDRTLVPGFGFKYVKGKAMPEKLLRGKTAKLIMTMDWPAWHYRWFQGNSAERMMRISTLHFCGISPVKSTAIGMVKPMKDAKRKLWLDKVREMGAKGI